MTAHGTIGCRELTRHKPGVAIRASWGLAGPHSPWRPHTLQRLWGLGRILNALWPIAQSFLFQSSEPPTNQPAGVPDRWRPPT